MNRERDERKPPLGRFRVKLLLVMMIVITGAVGIVLYIAHRNLAAQTARDLERQFQAELTALHNAQAVRQAALVERCRALVSRARIHAALEDNALDLLYLSAQDELRDVIDRGETESPPASGSFLHARFYRFLDSTGKVLPPPETTAVGELTAEEEQQLSLSRIPAEQQIGYLWRRSRNGSETVNEVIAMPIISNETGQVISALVMGFKPVELGDRSLGTDIKRGLWVNGRLHMPGLARNIFDAFAREVSAALDTQESAQSSAPLNVGGVPHFLLHKQLNPGSLYPPAHEVNVYPLDKLAERQRQLKWRAAGTAFVLLLAGFGVSHLASAKLSTPVEKLEADSVEERAQRERAEAALEMSHEELQRAARFSADASHQLKTPITVLRAGLEELLARDDLNVEARDEISALVHQTFRVTSIVEDLLLLSRMDAGHLCLDLSPVNLTLLVESWLDDFEALPDGLDLRVELDLPTAVYIEGEKRYTSLVLQNLLENARKYNVPGGKIRIAAHARDGAVFLRIGNTSQPIDAAAREHIFERFHRGAVGENVPGYGLGLNLARELARIHGGDLRLVTSENGWTEFEVRFRAAKHSTTDGVRAG